MSLHTEEALHPQNIDEIVAIGEMVELQAPTDADEERQLTAEQAQRFADEFAKSSSQLVGYASGLTHNRGEGEDLVQEAFVRAMKTYGARDDLDSFLAPVLYRTVKNLFLDGVRKRQIRQTTPYDFSRDTQSDSNGGVMAPYWGDVTPSAEDECMLSENLRGSLGIILDRLLDPQNRSASVKEALAGLVLMHCDGYRKDETASILNTTEGTVGSRKNRLIHTIREEFTKEDFLG